jgi:hypothetical protein
MKKTTCVIGLFYFYLLINTSIASNIHSDFYAEAYTELTTFKEKYGYAPIEKDLFKILSNPKCSLSVSECNELMQVLVSQHSPMITKENLIALVKAKMNSIVDFYCSYTIEQYEYDTNKKLNLAFEYAQKGNKRLLAMNGMEDSKTPNLRKSYDGNKIISYVFPDKSSGNRMVPTVEIRNPANLQFFIEDNMPLACSLLLDTTPLINDDASRYCENFNFLLFLNNSDVYVHENKHIIDGKECIVVGNKMRHVYCDTTRDFAVILDERYKIMPHTQEFFRLISQKKFSDFKDYGNGILLPMTINIERYDNKNSAGVLDLSVLVTVGTLTINSGIKDDFFTDFFPDNTIVVDKTKGMIYKHGDSASIGSLLQETVKPKSTSIYNKISIIVGLIMIVIAVVFKIRKRILKGRAS